MKKTEEIGRQSSVCHVSIVSNISFSPYFVPFLKLRFAESDISADVQIIRYESYSDEVERIKNRDLVAVLLNFECQYPNWYNDILSGKITLEQLRDHAVGECRNSYRRIREMASCPILWFGYENEDFKRGSVCGTVSDGANIIDMINAGICAFLDESDSHIDTKHLIAVVGISNAYDTKGKYRWNAPYSQQMTQTLADEIYKQYLIQKGISKKCLVLDCDNVLWGGILSEDGIGQIQLGSEGLGRPYQDFQRFLLSLYYHGVILAICSKNDREDVLRVFREHSGMILKEEHIACFRMNWDNKPDNIRKIADTLNIGLDSMVFVDDSLFEVEAVRALLPEVLAIQYDRDGIYDELSCFNLKDRIDPEQVAKRNQTYQTNARRAELHSEHSDFDSYLQALEVKVDIHEAQPDELGRIAELTQRTNQCTNGMRYTVAELSARLEQPSYRLYSVYVSDKFSDLGLVGAIGIDRVTLDLFSLSCRALGRNVEEKMLKVVSTEGAVDYKFRTTGKNDAIKYLLI